MSTMPATHHNNAVLISSIKSKGVFLELRKEDITQCRVELIVNPTNSKLLFGAGLSAKLLAKGGNEVFRASKDLIKKHGILQPGACVNSSAGMLPCRHLLHAVTPVWSDGFSGEEAALAASIKSIFSLAVFLKVESIALPMLSVGNFPYPKESVSKIMIKEILANIQIHKGTPLKLVRLAVEDSESLKELREELEAVKFMMQYEIQDDEPETDVQDVGSWIKEQRMPAAKPKAVQQKEREVKAAPPPVVPVAETDAVILNLVGAGAAETKDKVPPLGLKSNPSVSPKTGDFIDAETSGRKKERNKNSCQEKCGGCSIF